MKSKIFGAAVSVVGLLVVASPVSAGEGLQTLVRAMGLTTYSVTRKDSDLYDVLGQPYVVRTRYCYEFVYYEDAVILDNEIIFVDSDAVCDIEGIYRKQ